MGFFRFIAVGFDGRLGLKRNKRVPMNYKVIFIVDPVRSERIQMAKFVKQDQFLIMSFVAIVDCFRQMQYLNCDLIVFALREGKSEIRHLTQIKKKYRKIHFILYLTPDFPEANLEELKKAGFDSVYKANSPEPVREIVHDLLKPGDLPPRPETPHPIPAVLDDRA